MNKEQALQLIERLADKTGDKVITLKSILDLLESKKGNTRESFQNDEAIHDNCGHLMSLWYWCLKDHSPSLSTILDEAECDNGELKYPALELFSYLNVLFPNNNQNDIAF